MMSLRGLGVGVLLLGVMASVAAASTQKDLDSAAKHGKIAFIVVTDKGTEGADQAADMAKQAAGQVKKSTVVRLDRSDPANADLVAKYRLAGAPVPLILLAARNGVIAGGLVAAQATADKLVGMVPSPKKAEVLQQLQSGKAVLIQANRKSMATQADCSAACAAACGQLQDRCVTVQIDMDDPAETAFLASMKVNTASTEPVTLVVNAQGQITGTYNGAAEVAALVQAATKKAGGCCPSTVQNPNASCAPAKK
jgi:hypothetical protein